MSMSEPVQVDVAKIVITKTTSELQDYYSKLIKLNTQLGEIISYVTKLYVHEENITTVNDFERILSRLTLMQQELVDL